jgi:hypothetical protein
MHDFHDVAALGEAVRHFSEVSGLRRQTAVCVQ